MQDFPNMIQMKYHRMWPVYIAGIYNLEHRDADVWAIFMAVDFSYQKNRCSRDSNWTG